MKNTKNVIYVSSYVLFIAAIRDENVSLFLYQYCIVELQCIVIKFSLFFSKSSCCHLPHVVDKVFTLLRRSWLRCFFRSHVLRNECTNENLRPLTDFGFRSHYGRMLPGGEWHPPSSGDMRSGGSYINTASWTPFLTPKAPCVSSFCGRKGHVTYENWKCY